MGTKTREIEVDRSRLAPIALEHVPLLATLMDRSYTGTIDHEGETLEQCADEMRGTINGKYGPFVPQASNLVLTDGIAAAACLITMWKGKPLVAFSMADPSFQRRGYSKLLLEAAINALASWNEPVLYLVVTAGNVAAENLYRKAGFIDLGEALGGQPPPEF